MNKFSLALVFGTGLALMSAAPSSTLADVMSSPQALPAPPMTATQFNQLFAPIANAPAMSSPFSLDGAPTSGAIQSQVFQGINGTSAAGLYAYVYQIGVNNVTNSDGEPVHVDSFATEFNSTPVQSTLLGANNPAYAYSITGGPVGGLTQAAAGQAIQAPSSILWQAGQKIGTIRAQFVDATSGSGPLNAGAGSSTFAVITNVPYTQHLVSLQAATPQIGTPPSVYAAANGTIQPVPLPEPATVLAWAGMAGAVVLARRLRRRRVV
jgi:hypothetical protein